MASIFIHVDPDGFAREAEGAVAAGPIADGGAVLEFAGCPEGLTGAELLPRLNGLHVPPDTYRFDYGGLSSPPAGSCCGGRCGG